MKKVIKRKIKNLQNLKKLNRYYIYIFFYNFCVKLYGKILKNASKLELKTLLRIKSDTLNKYFTQYFTLLELEVHNVSETLKKIL